MVIIYLYICCDCSFACHQKWTGFCMLKIYHTRLLLKICMTYLANMVQYDKYVC